MVTSANIHRTLHVGHKSKKEREREAKEARAREAAAVGDANGSV